MIRGVPCVAARCTDSTFQVAPSGAVMLHFISGHYMYLDQRDVIYVFPKAYLVRHALASHHHAAASLQPAPSYLSRVSNMKLTNCEHVCVFVVPRLACVGLRLVWVECHVEAVSKTAATLVRADPICQHALHL